MTATNIFYNFVGFRYSPPLSIGEQQHSNQSITTAWLSIGEQQHSDQSITTAWLSIGEQQRSKGQSPLHG